jgi:hypothetical protein
MSAGSNDKWSYAYDRREASYRHDLDSGVLGAFFTGADTTPSLLGLVSLVTLLANTLLTRQAVTVRTAAWYPQPLPPFCDALALVRRSLWAYLTFQTSQAESAMVKLPRVLLDRFHDLLCYAA